MDRELDAMGMLDLMISPCFCVRNQKIVKCNAAAQGILIREGMDILPLLATGQTEYEEFSGGCLYLTLEISGVRMGASVTRVGDFDVFLPEEEGEQAELQSIALAAQELRGPLTGIMATAERLFPMANQQEDPALREQVARMNRGLYQMLRIIGNMSDACRYSATPAARMETVEISEFFREIFDRSQELMSHAGITLRFENLPHSLHMLVDSEKLERAANNMLSNALKFTPKGGTVEASLTRRGNMLYLTMQDSGSGTPAELRGNLFNRFLRQPGIEDTRHGIGLGMVLIRSVASMHGGTVLLEQTANGGLRLTMSMAIRQNADTFVRNNSLRVDYAGERDHALIELSECLPASLYAKEK